MTISSFMRLVGVRGFAKQVVPMPALSPTMTQGVIAEWLKKEGDKIKSGDVVAKIETDKATVDFEATDDSWLAKILKTGEVKVGEPIMMTCDEEEEIAGLKNFVLPATAAPSPPPAAMAAPKVEAAPAKTLPPPPSTPALAPAPSPSPPASMAAPPSDDYVAWPAWGRSLSKTPLGASLLRQQEAYFAVYGFSGVALEEEKKAEAPKDGKKK